MSSVDCFERKIGLSYRVILLNVFTNSSHLISLRVIPFSIKFRVIGTKKTYTHILTIAKRIEATAPCIKLERGEKTIEEYLALCQHIHCFQIESFSSRMESEWISVSLWSKESNHRDSFSEVIEGFCATRRFSGFFAKDCVDIVPIDRTFIRSFPIENFV